MCFSMIACDMFPESYTVGAFPLLAAGALEEVLMDS